MSPHFGSIDEVVDKLRDAKYLADESIATVAFLADRLDKPLLVEGPAGAGKTELAKALAATLAVPLIRLQCYEGVDETKALYEWNYKKQLLRIQAADSAEWDELTEDIFSEPFLLERPVLKALRASEPVVLLIDEVDKLDLEAEALLLEVLSDWQVTIHEMGTVKAARAPFVVLTSNNTRELSEALKRRCLYLYLDYPELDREKAIVLERVPEIGETLVEQVVQVIRTIRQMELKKAPSIAETLDWARTLLQLNITTLDDETVRRTLSIILKYQSDIEAAADELTIAPNPLKK